MQFYKARVLFLLYLAKFFTAILRIEMPPLTSVTALIQKDNAYLFLELSYLKGYGWPGGIVQAGETLEEALRREVFEETGLTVMHDTYLGSVPSRFHGIDGVSAVYRVAVTGDLKPSNEGALVWRTPREVRGKMAYQDAELTLQQYCFD